MARLRRKAILRGGEKETNVGDEEEKGVCDVATGLDAGEVEGEREMRMKHENEREREV
jgi:hypothetical protein